MVINMRAKSEEKSSKVKDFTSIKMEIDIKEVGKMMSKMVKDSTFSQTELGMKGSLSKVNLKDKESSLTFLLRTTILLSIMVNGLKDSLMEEDMLFIKTMTSMMENL